MSVAVERAYHLNVNCSDLDRSRAFYADILGLAPIVRTRPPVQPGTAFGLEQAQWDAWILAGAGGAAGGVVLDLLEWKVPVPIGRPATRREQGYSLLGVGVADIDATVTALRDAGSSPDEPFIPRPPGPRVSIVADPDGQLVELVEVGSCRLTHVVINVGDLDESRTWYERVLGLAGPVVDLPDRARTCYLSVPGVPWQIALRDWRSPEMVARSPRRANELGIFRHALFCSDIEAEYKRLVAMGVACYSPPLALDMGPGLPSDLKALFFDDPDGACLELIENVRG